MTFRLVMKEVALEQGVYATFMPKPFTDQPGSGMHTHVSLFEGDRNAFHDAVIRDSVTANSLVGQEHLAATSAGFAAQHGDPAFAHLQALGQLAGEMQLQASVITFSETFYVLGVALLLCIPLALFLRKPTPPPAGAPRAAGSAAH